MRDRHPTHGHDHSHGVSEEWVKKMVRGANVTEKGIKAFDKRMEKKSDEQLKKASAASNRPWQSEFPDYAKSRTMTEQQKKDYADKAKASNAKASSDAKHHSKMFGKYNAAQRATSFHIVGLQESKRNKAEKAHYEKEHAKARKESGWDKWKAKKAGTPAAAGKAKKGK